MLTMSNPTSGGMAGGRPAPLVVRSSAPVRGVPTGLPALCASAAAATIVIATNGAPDLNHVAFMQPSHG
jgi:hypothetical protein